MAILGGLLVFKEFDDFQNVTSEILFSLGVVMTALSVLCLSTIQPQEELRRTEYEIGNVTEQGELELSEVSEEVLLDPH